MKDAFDIEKAAHSHTRRILKEIVSQGATTGYSRTKKRTKVAKLLMSTPRALVLSTPRNLVLRPYPHSKPPFIKKKRVYLRDLSDVIVGKSFSSTIKGGKVFKPLSQMTSAEKKGIQGFHAKATGTTAEDNALREQVEQNWRGARLNLLRAGPKRAKHKGHTVTIGPIGGETGLAGLTVPAGSRRVRTQRQTPFLVGINPDSPHLGAVVQHELRHTEVRKPLSQWVRHTRNAEKTWGNEARADALMSPEELKGASSYWRLSHGQMSMKKMDPDYKRAGAAGPQRYREVEAAIKAKRGKVSKAKLPRLKRMSWNQPPETSAKDTIIYNGRALLDPVERSEAVQTANRAARSSRKMHGFFSPYKFKTINQSTPEGFMPKPHISNTDIIERRKVYEIPAVQAGAGAVVVGAGSGAFIAHRKRQKVSKIAMRPMYHGTTVKGARAIMRGKYVSHMASDRGGLVDRPAGLFVTPSRDLAERYALSGRSGTNRGELSTLHQKKGKVLVYNAVGVKPKYSDLKGERFRGIREEIYDPKSLGPPTRIDGVNRRHSPELRDILRNSKDEGTEVNAYRKWVRNNRTAAKYDKKVKPIMGYTHDEAAPHTPMFPGVHSEATKYGDDVVLDKPFVTPFGGRSHSVDSMRSLASWPKRNERGATGKRKILRLTQRERRRARVAKGMRLPGGERVRFRTTRRPNGFMEIEGRTATKRVDDGGSLTRGIGYLLLRHDGTVGMVKTSKQFERQGLATALRRHAESKGVKVKASTHRTLEGDSWEHKFGAPPPNKHWDQ